MTLKSDGNSTYEQDNGRILKINYNKSDKEFTGYWIEDNSTQRYNTARDSSYHWGRIALEFNSYFTSFDG